MARTLGSVAVGEIVKLKESGTPQNYIVVHQGKPDSMYDSSCDGTWIIRQDLIESRVWGNGDSNVLESSDIQSWLNSTMLERYDSDIQDAIKQVKIPYLKNGNNGPVQTGSNGLSCKIFLLSNREVGFTSNDGPYFPTDGAKLSYFVSGNDSSAKQKRIATLNGAASNWYTRSPYARSDTPHSVWIVDLTGGYAASNAINAQGIRPALVLPSTLFRSDDGSIITNTAPTNPSRITVPGTAIEGELIAVSWSASSDKDNNLAGYTLQRLLSNGSWTQAYKGLSSTIHDSAPPVGTTSVQYRVQAYDSLGLTSSWTTSSTVKVIKKAPSSITAPMIVMQGQPISITWDSVSDADSYVLQRKADAGGWEQVYAGSDTSYTDTAGNWSTVQYQVCGVFDGTNGAFAVSEVVTVAPASTLVISGQDSDLGTITADIPYNVVTDTGKQIVLTRTVNGALVDSRTVNSGFTGSIPVMDLPTGTGTIIITATVQTDSDPVTAKRVWTYTKAAQTFPGAGGVGQLTQDGQNVCPLTLAEAVKAIGGPWGGNLSTALDKLAMAAVYNRTRTPKYTEVKVDLSKTKAGDIVNLPENGVMVPFYVASLDYEPTLNTGGTRVLLVRKDVYQSGKWNESNVNTYSESTIDTWFNTTYKSMLDSKVLAEIGETAFYYTPGNSNNEVTTLERAVFALSLNELGITSQYSNKEGSTLAISAQLQIAYIQNNPVGQFTRTPQNTNVTGVNVLTQTGAWANAISGSSVHGYRPCFTLPATFSATFYVNQNGTVHADQEYAQGGSFADLWGNIIPTIKIETGSYVGTGTYGSSNPNKLTFGFEPKLVLVFAGSSLESFMIIPAFAGNPDGNGSSFIIGGSNACQVYPVSKNVDGNSLNWWVNGITQPHIQFNHSGRTYNYIAIG